MKMNRLVKLSGPMINFTHQRVDAVISFSVTHEQLVNGNGSEEHLKKCLLEALLKEAKNDIALTATLAGAGWNFIPEPGIDVSREYKHYGPEAVPIMKVMQLPSLSEFCKARGVELDKEPE